MQSVEDYADEDLILADGHVSLVGVIQAAVLQNSIEREHLLHCACVGRAAHLAIAIQALASVVQFRGDRAAQVVDEGSYIHPVEARCEGHNSLCQHPKRAVADLVSELGDSKPRNVAACAHAEHGLVAHAEAVAGSAA